MKKKRKIDWFVVVCFVFMGSVSVSVIWEAYLTYFVYFDSVLTPREKLIAYVPAALPAVGGFAILGIYRLIAKD